MRTDPDEVLSRARLALHRYRLSGLTRAAERAGELADAFSELDEWLSAGGYLPAAWQDAPKPSGLTRVLADSLDNPDGMCHEVTLAGDCTLPRDHSGKHDWEY